MNIKISSRFTIYPAIVAKAFFALAAIAVLSCMGCSSSFVSEEIKEIDTSESKDPLSFTMSSTDIENGSGRATGSTPLTSGFMVSTYKAFALSSQQTVMEKYNVEYKTSGTAWDGTVRPYWDYTGVSGQYEKYWDYANFPYRFHAIAPYPSSPSGTTLNDKTLHINAPYYFQTCTNGTVQTRKTDLTVTTTEAAEPHIIAQVQRNTDGTDMDLLAMSDEKKSINTASTTRNREVWVPFHHLNSKIRFGVYTKSLWATEHMLYIKDLTINVISDNFVTAATGYDATCNSTGNWRIDSGTSGFTSLTKKNASQLPALLSFAGGKSVDGNDLRKCQGQSSAFMLQCADGIMQLPQENVQLKVSLSLYTEDDVLKKTYTDIPVKIELPDNTEQSLLTWQPGYLYTYYLVLTNIDGELEIVFTASLTPWEDISGSLSTDLEK